MNLVDLFLSLIKSPFFLISLAFWGIAFVLVKILGKKKENVTIFFPFLILIRSKWLNKLFYRIAKKLPRFWKIFWNIGIVVSFLLMIYSLYFFISNFLHLLINPQPENAIVPLIPGVTIDLPMFTAMIIPLLITITVHEFSHAIAAETDDVKVKSSGIMGGGIFFIILYGAFVEVDEFQLYSKKIKPSTRLRVAAAGVWSNILLAGLVFLLLSIYPQTINLTYETQGFQIVEVVPNNQGGFNEGNVFPGDIVAKINGTTINNFEGPTLTDILLNYTFDQTGIKCSIGDQLVLQCYNKSSHQYYNRTVYLGHRAYTGFNYEKVNNSVFTITDVDDAMEGGNNFDKDLLGKNITAINGTFVDYSQNITLSTFLKQFIPDYQLILTDTTGENITIDVNFAPRYATSHTFRRIFVGINFDQLNSTHVMVTKVLKNQTEGGINEGLIEEGKLITQVNGIALNLTNMSFRDFIDSEINPQVGDVLILTDSSGKNYTLNTGAIPVIPVYIGINSQTYGVPKNWLGRFTGPNFPIKYYQFLFYTWMISFSLAIFNLLPAGIFDGGRMMKEVIGKLIGEKRISKAVKKLRYEFDPEQPRQHLFTHNIHKILSCNMLPASDLKQKTSTSSNIDIPAEDESIQNKKGDSGKFSEIKSQNKIALDYTALDTIEDGFIDSIKINSKPLPPLKTIIEVEVEFDLDEKEKVKKRIFRIISWVTGGIILASLLISLIKFNNTLFWL